LIWFALIVYVVIGLIAGFLGGLLGVGGGIVTVPSLMLIFWCLDFPPAHIAHLAIGTSLGAMVFTAAASAYAHYLKNGIQWSYFRALSPGIILGGVLSALVAGYLSSSTLKMIFGYSACLIGLYFSFARIEVKEGRVHTPRFSLLVAVGVGIGAISTMLGIGGGIVTVPLLIFFRLSMKNAIATSAAIGFLIAVTGALSFLFISIQDTIVEGSAGYLYLPAFFLIGLAAVLTVPFGVRLTYVLPQYVLRRTFGVFLLITGIAMLV